METFIIALQVVMVVLMWRWAGKAFDEGLNYMGWLYIVASAGNAASVAVAIGL
jgi:hypothetical protein